VPKRKTLDLTRRRAAELRSRCWKHLVQLKVASGKMRPFEEDTPLHQQAWLWLERENQKARDGAKK